MPGRIAVHERCDHGAAGLLELKEYDVVGAAALAQRDIGTQTHRTDPDNLVSDVDDAVSGQDARPVGRQRLQVGIQCLGDLVGLGGVRASDKWGLFNDVTAAVTLLGESGQRTIAGAPARPRQATR